MAAAAYDRLPAELLALDDAPREIELFSTRYEGLSGLAVTFA